METIYGNIQSLKSSQIKKLQQLYEQRQPSYSLTTPEFASALAQICPIQLGKATLRVWSQC